MTTCPHGLDYSTCTQCGLNAVLRGDPRDRRIAELDAALTRIRTEDLSRFDCTLIAAKAQGLIP